MENYSLSHLRALEAEAIHIIREVAAEFSNPVMLYSIGKDSSVMVRLAEKAFYPGKVPFPLLHIDSKWKFREMIEFRDTYAREHGWNLIVEYNREAYEAGVVISGQSSGAMCYCRLGYDNCGPGGAYMFLDTLAFVPYILCPHFEDWPEFLEDVKKQEYDAIGLDNDIIFSIVDGKFTIVDSHRNPRHTAYWMPADEVFRPHNLYREPQYLDAMAFEV